MNVTSLLENYDALRALRRDCHELPSMDSGAFRVETWVIHDPDALKSALSDFKPTTGWVQYTGAQGMLEDLGVSAAHEQGGSLLNAELADADRSLRIMHLGNGWQVILTHRGEGDPCLVDEVRHRAHGNDAALVYERYWQLSSGGAHEGEASPVHAALTHVEWRG